MTVYVPDGLGGLQPVSPRQAPPAPGRWEVDQVDATVAAGSTETVPVAVRPGVEGLTAFVSRNGSRYHLGPVRDSSVRVGPLSAGLYFLVLRHPSGAERAAGTITVT